MFDDDDWVFTPGAYITYPAYTYQKTERREEVAFLSEEPYKRHSAAQERRAQRGNVGWNSSLKAPYRPLGTPRFDISRRPASAGEEARIQIRHPSRSHKSQHGDRGNTMHIALESGKEERGQVSHSSYRVRRACIQSFYGQRVFRRDLTRNPHAAAMRLMTHPFAARLLHGPARRSTT